VAIFRIIGAVAALALLLVSSPAAAQYRQGARLGVNPERVEWAGTHDWKTITVTNSGNQPTGNLMPGASNGFEMRNTNCAQLMPGASCQIAVRPLPNLVSQAASGGLRITAQPGGTAMARLSFSLPRACLDLRQEYSQRSGVYVLAKESGEPYRAYCDMVTDGGGWTLAMRFDGRKNDLYFDAPYWTDPRTLDPNSLRPATQPSMGDAKFDAYNEVGGDQLRVQFVGNGFSFDISYPRLSGRTPLELFSGTTSMLQGDVSDGCNGQTLESMGFWDPNLYRLGRGPQFYGVNFSQQVEPHHLQYARMRFGVASGDAPDFIGHANFGVGAIYKAPRQPEVRQSVVAADAPSCAGACGCYGNGPSRSLDVGANLWVR
jgi:hypothetical protein